MLQGVQNTQLKAIMSDLLELMRVDVALLYLSPWQQQEVFFFLKKEIIVA